MSDFANWPQKELNRNFCNNSLRSLDTFNDVKILNSEEFRFFLIFVTNRIVNVLKIRNEMILMHCQNCWLWINLTRWYFFLWVLTCDYLLKKYEPQMFKVNNRRLKISICFRVLPFGPLVVAGRNLWNRVCLTFRSSLLPSALAFSWNCIIYFSNFAMVLETLMKLCMTAQSFGKTFFAPKIGEMGKK